ncbi:hypothetical protein ERD78_07150 [Allopusillimonas soli]|uniref:Uncharacterized protein n=1 Tax=Allopusillimonas soli TaxID=659016 RepID=A0A853F978_9BURK|nr:hypothetical protein [Allopusillimonas soli]NYT36643.1 hypothetical protein [Allopusillimonas soli]TEA75128.1 hypothetical protein ERD78_07150 [Allopusillimonas soli]
MRKTKLNFVASALMSILLSGQATATKIPYSLQAAEHDKEFQAALEKLSRKDCKLVIQYMRRIDLATVIPTVEAPPSDVDLSEAIASQKAVNEEKEKAKKSADDVLAQLKEAVVF